MLILNSNHSYQTAYTNATYIKYWKLQLNRHQNCNNSTWKFYITISNPNSKSFPPLDISMKFSKLQFYRNLHTNQAEVVGFVSRGRSSFRGTTPLRLRTKLFEIFGRALPVHGLICFAAPVAVGLTSLVLNDTLMSPRSFLLHSKTHTQRKSVQIV